MAFTVTRYQKYNKSKSTSSLFLIKMIAKLEMTYSKATNTEPPQTMGGT